MTDALLAGACGATATAALAHLHQHFASGVASRWPDAQIAAPQAAPAAPSAVQLVQSAVPKSQERSVAVRARRGADAGELIELHIDGVLSALVQLDDGDPLVPVRLAICEAHDDAEALLLDASRPAKSHVLGDVAARGQKLLTRLDALPKEQQLPLLCRWLCAHHDLFTATCSRCGHFLWPGAANAASLLPPTVRCSDGRAFLPACAPMDVEEGWLSTVPRDGHA